MSVDLCVAPPFGAIGRLLHDRFGWPDVGESTNVATNSAWVNLVANVKLHAPTAGALLKLDQSQFISARQTRQMKAEWRGVEDRFASLPLSAFVRVVLAGYEFEGAELSKSEGFSVVTISANEAAQLASSTVDLARDLGRDQPPPETLRDAFFYQCDEISRLVSLAVEAGRGLVLA